MWNFLSKRILHIVTVLVGISLLSFILANISAVDPAEAYAIRISRVADEEMIEQYRDELGFNQVNTETVPELVEKRNTSGFRQTHILPADRSCRICYPLCPLTLLLAGLSCVS